MQLELNKAVPFSSLTLQRLQPLVRRIKHFEEIPEPFTCSVGIVSDRTIRKLNSQFRGKAYATDVLSFRYTDEVGEIVISADRARAQAKQYGHTIADEAAWLFVHGFLHLLGWDHERSAREATEQRALEQRILQPWYTYAR